MFGMFSMVKSWPSDICLHIFVIYYIRNGRPDVSVFFWNILYDLIMAVCHRLTSVLLGAAFFLLRQNIKLDFSLLELSD